MIKKVATYANYNFRIYYCKKTIFKYIDLSRKYD